VIFNYDINRQQWTPSADQRTFIIGYGDGVNPFVELQVENPYRPDLATNIGEVVHELEETGIVMGLLNSERPGRFAFWVGDEVANNRLACRLWYDAATEITAVNNCPCTMTQANDDPLWVITAVDYLQPALCYKNGNVLCCYDK
jgi:hypothetical protein